ncbi:hypothetical protein IFM89_009959 [Coptis chinensis]|uniref:Uncharacterized protein n=1 Tax=Coptis chinensis TaxID=261450 RepID=A0A835HJM5_9MAGN|nr:hypothetical protein IFM89_009959 [Coptis chinensis]
MLGYELDGKDLDDAFWRFKAKVEKKKNHGAIWSLGDMQVTCGTLGFSTATVKLIGIDGVEHIACSVGTEYSMNSVTEGIDAIASTRVVIVGENSYTSTHPITGQTLSRTFRPAPHSFPGRGLRGVGGHLAPKHGHGFKGPFGFRETPYYGCTRESQTHVAPCEVLQQETWSSAKRDFVRRDEPPPRSRVPSYPRSSAYCWFT